jgi:hypothetical protein
MLPQDSTHDCHRTSESQDLQLKTLLELAEACSERADALAALLEILEGSDSLDDNQTHAFIALRLLTQPLSDHLATLTDRLRETERSAP